MDNAPAAPPPRSVADGRTPSADGRIPAAVVVGAVFGAAVLVVPLLGLVVRAPWPQLGSIVTDPATLTALGLSLATATVTTVITVLLGVPLAVVLARPGFRAAGLVRALVTVPLVLPPVVGGVALFAAAGRTGVLGQPLYALTGWALPFSTAAVVVAQVFVAMPFLVLTVEGALRGVDQRLVDAARSLGASPAVALRRVVLPLVRPSLVSGAVLAWARALGEFGATITFAGNFPGTTRTLPLLVYAELQSDATRAVGVSLIMFAVTVLVLVAVSRRWARPW